MARRVYGYKKRNVCSGHRYQDGIGAQAKSDKPIEITKEAFSASTTAVVEDDIIEVKAKAEQTDVPTEKPKVEALVDDGNEETGGLPKSMTDFMPAVQNNDATLDTEPQKVTTDMDDDTE